jgi:hypothetical protein
MSDDTPSPEAVLAALVDQRTAHRAAEPFQGSYAFAEWEAEYRRLHVAISVARKAVRNAAERAV